MIRSSVKIDRRRKPSPSWEPPRSSSTLQRIEAAMKTAQTLKESSRDR